MRTTNDIITNKSVKRNVLKEAWKAAQTRTGNIHGQNGVINPNNNGVNIPGVPGNTQLPPNNTVGWAKNMNIIPVNGHFVYYKIKRGVHIWTCISCAKQTNLREEYYDGIPGNVLRAVHRWMYGLFMHEDCPDEKKEPELLSIWE